MRLADLRGRSVAVWGTGREGRAALTAISAVEPANLVAVDDNTAAAAELPLPTGDRVPVRTGEDAFAALAAADVVVRSPGVPQTHPWVIELRQKNIPITSGTALWLADHADRTVAVTGSKGKSTTASLLSHLLAGVGRRNAFGGNIGVPLLELPEADLYVVELSSYQASDLIHSPRVAVLTSLFPEHLDAHGGAAEYYRDKLNLIAHDPGLVVFNGADERLSAEIAARPDVAHAALAAALPDSAVQIGPGPGGTPYLFFRGSPLFARDRLALVGRHNEANLLVALTVLDGLRVDLVSLRSELTEAVASFRPLPHRLTEIADPSGLTFVDDTLATSPYAAMHAVDAYAGRPLTLIVGGTDRGLDYTPLREHLAADGRTLTVIGIPDSGARILAALEPLESVTTELAEDLPTAVSLARKLTPTDGVVLLSPAAPSYGQFRDFEHRSQVFAKAIEDTAAIDGRA